MNYNSIEEIISSNITNMTLIRDNEILDDDIDTIDGVDWFIFNEITASNIYVSGNSWIGFGSSTEHLEVNSSDCAMYSLYREEGTLYNNYKFLKIRWEGYNSYYETSSEYALAYDVILWDTGDILLHMTSIPYYKDGNYYLNDDYSTYSYDVTEESPYITFKKVDSGFEVSNSIIEFIKIENRYLIRSNNKYYTIIDDSISEINIQELSSDIFLNNGTEKIPDYSIISNLNDPEILYWTDNINASISNITVTGTPPATVLYYNIENIQDNYSIEKIEPICTDDILYSVTFDNGSTWKYYSNGWITSLNDLDGMTSETMINITKEQWEEVATSSTIQIRCLLTSKSSFASIIGVQYN